jgi:hypothetical protein
MANGKLRRNNRGVLSFYNFQFAICTLQFAIFLRVASSDEPLRLPASDPFAFPGHA